MLLLAGNVLSGVIEQELAWVEASWSSALNGPGSASVTVPLTRYGANAGSAAAPFVAATTLYIVEDDRSVAWWGIAWSADVDPEARTITFDCAEVHSMLARRVLRRDLNFAQVEQASIAVALVTEAQTGADRNLRIDTSRVTPTGVLRDRNYVGVERPKLGELLGSLASVINGFDFDFPAEWPGGGAAPVPFLRLDYPRLGRRLPQPLVATGPVILRSLTYDGTEMAGSVDAVGDQALTVPQTASGLLPGRPALDAVVSRSTVKVNATLAEHAAAWRDQHDEPARVAQVEVALEPADALAVRVGDVVRLIEQDSVGLDADFLVTGMSTQVAGAGRLVTLSLAWPIAPGGEET